SRAALPFSRPRCARHRSARRYLGDLPAHLKNYSLEYSKELRSYSKITFKNNILDEILGAQIILCGDYHSSPQAQRTVLRILRQILPRVKKERKNLYLGLEFLRAQDTIRAQQVLRSEISEDRFLETIGFHRWGFLWQNYAPLVKLAQDWQIPLFGLSPERMGPLQARDAFAARVICNWTQQDPNSILFCLMGDLHLAQNHLPEEIRTELKNRQQSKKILTIHQNYDDLYWKLVQKQKENKGEVIQLKKDVFCILNTAPWVKLQSHLNSVEQTPNAEEMLDSSDTILQLIEGIAYFLELKKTQIGSGADLDVRASGKSESYFSYADRIFYLGAPNLNHLAKLSSQYVHSKLSGFKGSFEEPARDFYPMVWTEVLGFLGSKIINPNRKCQGIIDFKTSSEPAMKLAWRHINKERVPAESEVPLYPEVAKLLGKLLGQALFELILKNKLSLSALRDLYGTPFGAESESLYFDWCTKVDQFSLRHFSSKQKW
ncbi:hypothetical protein EBT16_08045, partial [bacterium]|nr:hypothetical protein [bacterium]